MCASASAFFSRLWSLPMRAPPVRSYIHIALPSARATFGLMSPSFEKIGMRNGRSCTRCGRVAAQALALAQRLVDEADVAVLQVAQAAVHELGRLRRRAAGEVVALDQRGAQPAAGGVEGDAGAGDAAADDQHVERLRQRCSARRGRRSRAPSGQPQPQPPQPPRRGMAPPIVERGEASGRPSHVARAGCIERRPGGIGSAASASRVYTDFVAGRGHIALEKLTPLLARNACRERRVARPPTVRHTAVTGERRPTIRRRHALERDREREAWSTSSSARELPDSCEVGCSAPARSRCCSRCPSGRSPIGPGGAASRRSARPAAIAGTPPSRCGSCCAAAKPANSQLTAEISAADRVCIAHARVGRDCADRLPPDTKSCPPPHESCLAPPRRLPRPRPRDLLSVHRRGGRAAKAVCDECPVRGTCLEHALGREKEGVWGGSTERERRRIIRQRRRAS